MNSLSRAVFTLLLAMLAAFLLIVLFGRKERPAQ
jgi:hypothetical protein